MSLRQTGRFYCPSCGEMIVDTFFNSPPVDMECPECEGLMYCHEVVKKAEYPRKPVEEIGCDSCDGTLLWWERDQDGKNQGVLIAYCAECGKKHILEEAIAIPNEEEN